MSFNRRNVGNCVVLDCSGKITLGPETTGLRNAVREACEEGVKKIVLNLGDVSYIDSSGIGEMVSSFVHASNLGSKLVLLNLTKKIQQLLVIAKLLAIFDVYEDEEQALSGCQ